MAGPKSRLKHGGHRFGSRLEATRFVRKRCTHLRPKLQRKNSRTTSFGENGLFSCGRSYFGKQLLPQINICCREVMQNNKMTSLMGQPFLDAGSI